VFEGHNRLELFGGRSLSSKSMNNNSDDLDRLILLAWECQKNSWRLMNRIDRLQTRKIALYGGGILTEIGLSIPLIYIWYEFDLIVQGIFVVLLVLLALTFIGAIKQLQSFLKRLKGQLLVEGKALEKLVKLLHLTGNQVAQEKNWNIFKKIRFDLELIRLGSSPEFCPDEEAIASSSRSH
jgi:hypothetical protein